MIAFTMIIRGWYKSAYGVLWLTMLPGISHNELSDLKKCFCTVMQSFSTVRCSLRKRGELSRGISGVLVQAILFEADPFFHDSRYYWSKISFVAQMAQKLMLQSIRFLLDLDWVLMPTGWITEPKAQIQYTFLNIIQHSKFSWRHHALWANAAARIVKFW